MKHNVADSELALNWFRALFRNNTAIIACGSWSPTEDVADWRQIKKFENFRLTLAFKERLDS